MGDPADRHREALRRCESDACEAQTIEPPEDQFETFGLVYHRSRYKARRSAANAEEDGSLRGTGCCDGRVIDTVRILRSPADANGLRPAGGAGEILSHSTTVARELGIPTIVGIPGLTTILRDGQRVTIDGAQGVVTVLDEGPEGT